MVTAYGAEGQKLLQDKKNKNKEEKDRKDLIGGDHIVNLGVKRPITGLGSGACLIGYAEFPGKWNIYRNTGVI